MKAAWDAGVNFFDCAEAYAEGESEKVMGEAIKKYGWKRNDVSLPNLYSPQDTKRVSTGKTNWFCSVQIVVSTKVKHDHPSME